MKFFLASLVAPLVILIAGCTQPLLIDETACKMYQFGENKVICTPEGCSYATEPVTGRLDEDKIIDKVVNMEEVEMTVSYIPDDDADAAKRAVVMPVLEPSTAFSGLPAKGVFEIVRVEGIFKGRNDGVDLQVCFQ